MRGKGTGRIRVDDDVLDVLTHAAESFDLSVTTLTNCLVDGVASKGQLERFVTIGLGRSGRRYVQRHPRHWSDEWVVTPAANAGPFTPNTYTRGRWTMYWVGTTQQAKLDPSVGWVLDGPMGPQYLGRGRRECLIRADGIISKYEEDLPIPEVSVTSGVGKIQQAKGNQ